MSEPELTVVLPAFNAGRFIADSVSSLSAGLTAAGVAHEVLVVDDGSADDTSERLAHFHDPQLRALALRRNRGKGAAVKEGLRHARARYIVLTDDDVPYGVDGVLRCYDELRRGAGLVIGDRTLPESRLGAPVSWARRFLTVGSIALRRLLGVVPDLRDTQCGLKGLTAPFARHVATCSRVDRFSFDVELIAIARENGLTGARIPVALRGGLGGSARLIFEAAIAARDVLRIAWHIRRGSYRAGEGRVGW